MFRLIGAPSSPAACVIVGSALSCCLLQGQKNTNLSADSRLHGLPLAAMQNVGRSQDVICFCHCAGAIGRHIVVAFNIAWGVFILASLCPPLPRSQKLTQDLS